MASRPAAAHVALALLSLFGCVDGFLEAKKFTTNAICRQFNCINPVFPGLEDLRRLEAAQLQCQPSQDAKQHMQFCKNAILYDVALPSPKSKGSNASTLQSVVLRQDNAAATMYYYHLAGMNVEAWEHQHPEESGNDCTKAVWKMVCHTYFPRAEAGCKAGEATKHLRPCKNVCGSYVQACNVECCDESVQCVFSKKLALLNGSAVMSTGYADELGPSATCTGAASRKSPGIVALLVASFAFLQFLFPASQSGGVAAVGTGVQRRWRPSWKGSQRSVVCFMLFALCTTLQGCMLGQIFSHPTPSWEQAPNYWERFQFIPEGAPASKKVYNSCEFNVPKQQQCSGNGECSPWRPDMLASVGGQPTLFCKCFRDWADPECKTQRKSQMTAFFLSAFLGFFGADRFYLMDYYSGFLKLATFGGVGVWWVFDMIRIGSSPVYANEYRLAYDLPHWLFVMFTVALFTFLGYFIFGVLARAYKWEKAKNKFLMQEEMQQQKLMAGASHTQPEQSLGMPGFASYSLPLNADLCNGYGGVPEMVKQSGNLNPYSPYGVYAHAMQGYHPSGKYDSHLQPNPAMVNYGYGY